MQTKIPDLIIALKDEDWRVRESAAEAIGKIGVNDEQFETILRMLKKGETSEERHGAAIALGELKNLKAIPALITALKDEDWSVRSSAAEAIGKIAEANPGKEVLEAITALINALKDEDSDVRLSAAEAIREIAEANPGNKEVLEAITALINALKDDYSRVRESAAEAIGKIGEANPNSKEVLEAIPALITALKDNNKDVRKRAAEVIGKIGVNDEQFETIVRMLKEGETWEERHGAAIALGELKNLKAIPALITALKDNNKDVRKRAAEAIEKIAEINPNSKEVLEAIPALITALKDEGSNVRWTAAEAIGKIAEANPNSKEVLEAIPALITALKDEDSDVRLSAAEAIGKIAEANPGKEVLEAVPALITALKDENSVVRLSAAEAIGKISEKLVEEHIKLAEQAIEKGEFEEALKAIRTATFTIAKFYEDVFLMEKKINKTMGKDRDLLEKRREILEKLQSLTNRIYEIMEKEGPRNPLNENEPMEWKLPKRNDGIGKENAVKRDNRRHH